MFVQDFVDVSEPFETIAPSLVRNPAWFDPIARDAVSETVARLGAVRPGQVVPRDLPPLTVRCMRGLVRLRSDALVMPIAWETNLPVSTFPGLDGELEVVPLAARVSRIALRANVGPAATTDDGVTRRAVESGLRAFLGRLAAELQPAPEWCRPSS